MESFTDSTRAFVESVKDSKYFIFEVFLKFPLKYLNLRDVFGSKILHTNFFLKFFVKDFSEVLNLRDSLSIVFESGFNKYRGGVHLLRSRCKI